MSKLLVDTIEGGQQLVCEFVRRSLDTIFTGVTPGAPPLDELTPEERARIADSLRRLRNDIAALPPGLLEDVSQLLDRAFGGPEGFVRAVRGWAMLVDALIDEAERDLGSTRGRGVYKRRQVKAALLYLARQTRVDIPRVPAFLEPLVWDAVMDPAVDLLVRFVNRNDLWSSSVQAAAPLRRRAAARVSGATGVPEWIARTLTRISWRLVFAASPVSPRLKGVVDDFLRDNPQPIDSVLMVAAFLVEHSAAIVVLADIFAIVIPEAARVEAANETHRKAYARELVLALIDRETGLPDRGSLRFRLVVVLVDLGVEVFFDVFQRRSPSARISAAQPPREAVVMTQPTTVSNPLGAVVRPPAMAMDAKTRKKVAEGTVVTMYTEDVSYRMRTVFAIIVVVAIGLGYVLRGMLPAAPHIIAPAALLLYAVLFWFYDAILWKIPPFTILNSGIPNIGGEWDGHLKHDKTGEDLPVQLSIRQTWSKLALILKTPEAFSRNTLAGLQVRDPNAIVMTWVYQFDMPHRPKFLTEHGRGIMEVTLHRKVAGQSMEGATLVGSLYQCEPTETLDVKFTRPGPFYWNPKPL